jgi:hypothetical protein
VPLAASRVKHAVAANLDTLKQLLRRRFVPLGLVWQDPGP